MPIHKVGKDGEEWGNHGKIYHGANAKKKAEKQAAAAHANGFVGESVKKPLMSFRDFVEQLNSKEQLE